MFLHKLKHMLAGKWLSVCTRLYRKQAYHPIRNEVFEIPLKICFGYYPIWFSLKIRLCRLLTMSIVWLYMHHGIHAGDCIKMSYMVSVRYCTSILIVYSGNSCWWHYLHSIIQTLITHTRAHLLKYILKRITCMYLLGSTALYPHLLSLDQISRSCAFLPYTAWVMRLFWFVFHNYMTADYIFLQKLALPEIIKSTDKKGDIKRSEQQAI